jgi:hypothetical protein
MNHPDSDDEQSQGAQVPPVNHSPASPALPLTAQTQAQEALPDASTTRPRSAHRPAPMAPPGGLDADRAFHFGSVVAELRGADKSDYSKAQLCEWLNDQVSPALDPTSDATLARLACHLPVLEALFVEFAGRAATVKNPDAAASLVKVALNAQAAANRTYATLAELKARQPRPLVDAGDGTGS